MSVTYFTEDAWISKSITFTEPTSSTWVITHKLCEDEFPSDYEEATRNGQAPSASATFQCHDSEFPERKGIMIVQMQIPYEGTLLENDQSWQASGKVPPGIKLLIDAYKLLSTTPSRYIPSLLGALQGQQPENSRLVPGGFIQFLVHTAIPGAPLSNGLCSDGSFWELPLEERNQIRLAFEDTHRCLSEARVHLPVPDLDQLFWDRDKRTFTICGFFEPMDTGIEGHPVYEPEPFSGKDLYLFGLATPPRDHVDFNVPICDLENEDSGWVL